MKKIITISRQFGSGGREIGELVGKKLNIPVYDKYIIENVAKQSGFESKLVKKALDDNSMSKYASKRFKINGMNVDELLYIEEKRIINELASKESCIFIGRCSDYILKDNPEAMHVFIYADNEHRLERIKNGDYEGNDKPNIILEEKDKKRAMNYCHFTNREWGNKDNYDLMLNSSRLSIEDCANIIIELFNK